MNRVINTPAKQLGEVRWNFADPRLAEMLFRYRARNFPDGLDSDEIARWQSDRLARLESPGDHRQLNFERYFTEIAAAREAYASDGRAQTILDQLQDWGQQLSLPQNL